MTICCRPDDIFFSLISVETELVFYLALAHKLNEKIDSAKDCLACQR